MSKQDRQGVRTATDLERKYGFGKSFAEINGIATDARNTAVATAEEFKKSMTAEQIFNVLTNNGANQGLYRGPDGEIYINGEYIKAVDAIFTHDINMTGTFTYKTTTFFEPEQEELDTIKKHILGTATIQTSKIALYDFDNDGVVDVVDSAAFRMAMWGTKSLSDWSGAVKTEATMTIDLKNPNKLIRIQGTNMWGRVIDRYLGVGYTNIRDIGVKNYIVEEDYVVCDDGSAWNYEKWSNGKAVLWSTMNVAYSNSNKCRGVFALPFAFTSTPHTIATIATLIGNFDDTVKAENNKAYIAVEVQNPNAVFAEGDTVPVSLYVVGQWK